MFRSAGPLSPSVSWSEIDRQVRDEIRPRSVQSAQLHIRIDHLPRVFHALGDAMRREMLRDLTGGERTVSQLAEPFAMSLAAASKHIKALENAGLIRREVRGRTHLCRLAPQSLASAHQWLSFYERYWSDRLDLLDWLLREEDAREARKPKKRR